MNSARSVIKLPEQKVSKATSVNQNRAKRIESVPKSNEHHKTMTARPMKKLGKSFNRLALRAQTNSNETSPEKNVTIVAGNVRFLKAAYLNEIKQCFKAIEKKSS